MLLLPQVNLSSSVAHENMVQLLDVFAEGTELVIVVGVVHHGMVARLYNRMPARLHVTAGTECFDNC